MYPATTLLKQVKGEGDLMLRPHSYDASFVGQRDDRVDATRAPGGHVAGHQRCAVRNTPSDQGEDSSAFPSVQNKMKTQAICREKNFRRATLKM
jgi:hypothetical protein